MKRIITIEQATKISKNLRNKHKAIVLTGGCFDILHLGHLALLQNAKKQGDVLMVLLESDEKIKQLKGEDRPIHTQQERALMLASFRYVDYVILLPTVTSDKDYDDLVQKIKPSIIATTENDPKKDHKKRQAEKVGAALAYVIQYIPNTSSSKLIEKLQKDL